MEAARRKFTPEFINRIDRVVVFQALGHLALRKILELELNAVQQRVFNSSQVLPFVISVAEPAKAYLLSEGTDLKYGARHLKRAIDRHLVHPLSNLMASHQVRGGDLVRVDFDSRAQKLIFFKDAEDLSTHAMLQMVDDSIVPPPMIAAASAVAEMPRVASARSGRR
jgi:ATP-dependent Clp protease ATP-binding subunit ClpA